MDHARTSAEWVNAVSRKERLWRTLMTSFDFSLVPTGLSLDPEFEKYNSPTTQVEGVDEHLNVEAHPLYNYVSLDIVEAVCRLAKRPLGSIDYLAYVEHRNTASIHNFDSRVLSLITYYDPELKRLNLPAGHPRLQCPKFLSHPNSHQQHAFQAWMEHAMIGTHHKIVRSIHRDHHNRWPESTFWYQPQPQQQQGQQQEEIGKDSTAFSAPRLILPSLEAISFEYVRDNITTCLVDFIRAHREQYPDTLTQLRLDSVSYPQGDAVRELLVAYGSNLRHFDCPNSNVQINSLADCISQPSILVSLHMPTSTWDMGPFLAQCTSLERLHIVNPCVTDFDQSRDRVISEAYHSAMQRPVFSLQHLVILSSGAAFDIVKSILAATKAYSRTLVTLQASSNPYYYGVSRLKVMLLDTWAIPMVESLVAASATAENTLTALPSALRHITNRWDGTLPDMLLLTHEILCRRFIPVLVQTPLFQLRKIHLTSLCTLYFSLWSLAACPGLESLTLCLHESFMPKARVNYRRETFGRVGNWSLCCVPNLKELNILGPWYIPSKMLVAMLTTRRIQTMYATETTPTTTTTTTVRAAMESKSASAVTQCLANRDINLTSLPGNGNRNIPTLPKLLTLDLRGCRAFSAKALQHAVRRLPSLCKVSMSVHSRDQVVMQHWKDQVQDRIHVEMDIRPTCAYAW